MYEYQYTTEVHSIRGARVGVEALFENQLPQSLLDVGCGTGTWMQAALNAGTKEIVGIDGVSCGGVYPDVTPDLVINRDLTQPFDLQRRFDVVFSFEVAEHIPKEFEKVFIASLCRHGDKIFFSAACPHQYGQNHINCQWPEYWQALFNAEGYTCSDEIRWAIWDKAEIEPWYRQNIFCATKNKQLAGYEPRLKALVHPEMLTFLSLIPLQEIEEATKPMRWFLKTLMNAFSRKVQRWIEKIL
jgi:SAM-dependent methyltransferase